MNNTLYGLVYTHDEPSGAAADLIAVSNTTAPLCKIIRKNADIMRSVFPDKKWGEGSIIPADDVEYPMIARFVNDLNASVWCWSVQSVEYIQDDFLSEKQMNRLRELSWINSFASEGFFNDGTSANQLRALWTAYCLHHSLNTDTKDYDDDLRAIWQALQANGGALPYWDDYESFDNFMTNHLRW